MIGNKTAMSESFYMSNMSPQHPSLNRGKWQKLEDLVRTWVLSESSTNNTNSANHANDAHDAHHANDTNYTNDANDANITNDANSTNTKLYVITGTILKSPLGTIGKNKVAIPSHYYKIIYIPNRNTMIAFLLPNQKLNKNLDVYSTTVDTIEHLTNIDFFPPARGHPRRLA